MEVKNNETGYHWKRKIFFGISIVALVLVLIITIVVGPKLDIQFKGGSIATYTYTGDITPDEFGKTVESFLGQDVTVQKQENSVTGQTSMVVSLTSNQKPDHRNSDRSAGRTADYLCRQ